MENSSKTNEDILSLLGLTEKKEETGTYEDYGISNRMTKLEAPIFYEENVTFNKIKMGDVVADTIGNVGSGTVLRGSLSRRAKASPFIVNCASTPVYVNCNYNVLGSNIMVALSGNGSPNNIDGWYYYGDFPIKDRTASHNTGLAPNGIAIDSRAVFIAQGNKIYKIPLNFSSITEITSGSALPAINGLTSDDTYLYTNNGSTFYKISVDLTANTYTFTQSTLSFGLSKTFSFDGKFFYGYDTSNKLIRMWKTDNSLWRSVGCIEDTICGIMVLKGMPHIAYKVQNSNGVQILPLLI